MNGLIRDVDAQRARWVAHREEQGLVPGAADGFALSAVLDVAPKPVDFGVLVLRLVAGSIMVAHGVNHGRNLDGTASWFESIGFRKARLQAALSSLGEISIGIGLILGPLTTIAGAALIATLLVAFVSNHRSAGFFVFNRPVEGWEYLLTLASIGVAVAVTGAGSISLDAVIGLDLSGWLGGAIAAAGALAGALQLATFWRPPQVSDN
ncbi:MAG: DoxX family membrane protein [Gammaproteobacteria bacterium]|nr:DoxX family membrane protein [Gammaproteobacteria bacterium]